MSLAEMYNRFQIKVLVCAAERGRMWSSRTVNMWCRRETAFM